MPRKKTATYTGDEEAKGKVISAITAGVTLSDICNLPHAPSRAAVLNWVDEDEVFRGAFARAEIRGADALADKVNAIALSSTPATAVSDRLAVTALMWRAARFSSRYSPPSTVDAPATTGPAGAIPTISTADALESRRRNYALIDRLSQKMQSAREAGLLGRLIRSIEELEVGRKALDEGDAEMISRHVRYTLGLEAPVAAPEPGPCGQNGHSVDGWRHGANGADASSRAPIECPQCHDHVGGICRHCGQRVPAAAGAAA